MSDIRREKTENISKLKIRLMEEDLSEENIQAINQTIRELEEELKVT